MPNNHTNLRVGQTAVTFAAFSGINWYGETDEVLAGSNVRILGFLNASDRVMVVYAEEIVGVLSMRNLESLEGDDGYNEEDYAEHICAGCGNVAVAECGDLCAKCDLP